MAHVSLLGKASSSSSKSPSWQQDSRGSETVVVTISGIGSKTGGSAGSAVRSQNIPCNRFPFDSSCLMAKKKQNRPKRVQDAAILSRINFLEQAAHVVPLPLQRHYLATSKVARKKTMLKLDPKLKRLSCRRCLALLSPQSGNITTRITAINEKNDLLEIECRHCGAKRRFPITDNYTLYSDREPLEVAQIH